MKRKSIKLTPLLIRNPFDWKKPLFYFSALQRIVTNSYFNHGAILVEYDNGDITIVEAIGHGVREVDYETWKGISSDRIVYSFIPKTSGDWNFLEAQIGKKYQFSIWYTYALFLLSKKIFGCKSKITEWFSTKNNEDKWFCYELVLTCFGDEENSFGAGDYIEAEYKIVNIKLP